MATSRSFSTMLNDFLPNDLLKAEFYDRNYFFSNVKKDESWLGGDLIIAFQGARASSVRFGGLPAAADISQHVLVRGTITNQPESWMSLLFYEKDLVQHGKMSKQSFLKILPGQLEDGMNFFQQQLSLAITNGPTFCKATGDGDSSGNITVDFPERLQIGMKVTVDDDDTAAVDGYVTAINTNTGVVVIKDARTSGSAVNLANYTVAQNAKLYMEDTDPHTSGYASNRLSSIKDALLPYADGGSESLYGTVKTLYPYTQAVSESGSGATATNLIEKIFDLFVKVKRKGKGNPDRACMSYENFGYCLKIIDAQKGSFHKAADGTKTSVYGWTEVEVFGPRGVLKLVAVPEMDNDWIGILDMSAFTLYSNGGLRKRVSPDGIEFYETRTDGSGYSYIVDCVFYGDLVCEAPSRCGILHSIAIGS